MKTFKTVLKPKFLDKKLVYPFVQLAVSQKGYNYF